jgi:SAM-dependent methyltransferase
MTLFSRILEEIRYWRLSSWSFGDVGAHWDSTHEYDEINEATYSYFRRFTDGLRLSNLEPNGTVLDFASRTGLGTTYFYQKGKVARAVCMDVSRRMGEICVERISKAGLADFLWVPLKDYTFPLKSSLFDSILCFETVEHFDDPESLVSELGRVIKLNGILILTTPNVLWEPIHAFAAVFKLHHSEGPHRFLSLKKIKKYILNAGFEIEALETTVLVPAGPRLFTQIGEWIERRTQGWLMPILGLRRVVIARKIR